jgi:creatinine amidohydrolase
VETANWPAVEEMLGRGSTAVLPIGAGSKEHGRHLPMNTDQRQAEWLVDHLIERLPVVVWPAVVYGYYPVFVQYPGSISLSENTFSALVTEILDGIEDAGAGRTVVLNTGISTIAPLQQVVARRSPGGVCRLVNIYEGANFSRESVRLAEQDWGGHADEIETSMMLAIDKAAVNLGLARPAPRRIVRGLFNRSDPEAPNYSPDGVNGDPSLASEAKGQALLAALLEDVLAAIAACGERA